MKIGKLQIAKEISLRCFDLLTSLYILNMLQKYWLLCCVIIDSFHLCRLWIAPLSQIIVCHDLLSTPFQIIVRCANCLQIFKNLNSMSELRSHLQRVFQIFSFWCLQVWISLSFYSSSTAKHLTAFPNFLSKKKIPDFTCSVIIRAFVNVMVKWEDGKTSSVTSLLFPIIDQPYFT